MHKSTSVLIQITVATVFLKTCLKYLFKTKAGQDNLLLLFSWVAGIESLFDPRRELHNNCRFKYLLTYRLNQDCIKIVLEILR